MYIYIYAALLRLVRVELDDVQGAPASGARLDEELRAVDRQHRCIRRRLAVMARAARDVRDLLRVEEDHLAGFEILTEPLFRDGRNKGLKNKNLKNGKKNKNLKNIKNQYFGVFYVFFIHFSIFLRFFRFLYIFLFKYKKYQYCIFNIFLYNF